jgi:hypothetical protein
MCGPKFCSMNISSKVEEFTEADAAKVLGGEDQSEKSGLVKLSGD